MHLIGTDQAAFRCRVAQNLAKPSVSLNLGLAYRCVGMRESIPAVTQIPHGILVHDSAILHSWLPILTGHASRLQYGLTKFASQLELRLPGIRQRFPSWMDDDASRLSRLQVLSARHKCTTEAS